MKYTFVNRPSVKLDIIEAVGYYKKINTALAHQFLFRIREAKFFIGKNTLVFEIKYKNVRTLLLKQFPYHIHYIVDIDKSQIIILAIIHAYRNPKDYTL
jgi:plasmid stabilization system protein ParE